MTTELQRTHLLPLFVCLGLIAAFPIFSLSLQGSTALLAPRIGEVASRFVTEGAVWFYAVLVLSIALFGERRSLASIGLRLPTLGTLGWGLGAAVALLAMGAVASFITYNVLHQPNRSPADVEALVGDSLVYALCLAVRGGVIEEIFYRGLAIEQLTILTGQRWFSALVATVFFIAMHALRFDARQLIPIATTSIGFAVLYLWRRNLWINIIAHVLIDAVALGAVAVRATSLY